MKTHKHTEDDDDDGDHYHGNIIFNADFCRGSGGHYGFSYSGQRYGTKGS